MASKHSQWQARWDIDQREGTARHDNGLRVRLVDGVAASDNAAEISEALAQAHGAHNAQAMVQRLIREGAQLLIDPYSRGWRN